VPGDAKRGLSRRASQLMPLRRGQPAIHPVQEHHQRQASEDQRHGPNLSRTVSLYGDLAPEGFR
jgi:hypothetical protein